MHEGQYRRLSRREGVLTKMFRVTKSLFAAAVIVGIVAAANSASPAPPAPQKPIDQNVPQDVGKAPLPPTTPDAVQERDPTTQSNALGIPSHVVPAAAVPKTQVPGSLINEQIAVLPVEGVTQFRARTALGLKVLDAAGEDVGEVEDLVLDQDGRLAAIVITIGGFLGIGGKNIAVASDKARLIPDESGRIVELEVSKDDLANAPEFKTQDDLKSELKSKTKALQ